MENSKISSAVEDIRTIKQVIERTDNSVLSFGKISFWWGIIFMLSSAVSIIVLLSPETLRKFFMELHPTVGYFFPLPLVILLVTAVYFWVSKTSQLNNTEKKLTAIWAGLIAVIVLSNLIPQTFSLPGNVNGGGNHVAIKKVVISISSPTSIFIYSLGLFITSLLASYRQFKFTAVLYLAIGIASLYSDGLRRVLVMFVMPVTFLYLGICLYINKLRNARHEHPSNT